MAKPKTIVIIDDEPRLQEDLTAALQQVS